MKRTRSIPNLPPPTQAPDSERQSEDGICDGPENSTSCPADCAEAILSTAPSQDDTPSPSIEASTEENTYWVTNPASGAKLYVRILLLDNWNGEALPTLVLVPGFTDTIDPNKASLLADYGFTIVIFDLDGHGRSQGSEDLDRTIHRDRLVAVIPEATSLSGVGAEQMGLFSFSYGIMMATGALALHPDPPCPLLDRLGRANRPLRYYGELRSEPAH